MKIKDLPKGLRELAEKRIEKDDSLSYELFQKKNELGHAFSWKDSKEGYKFWSKIDNGNFKPYYKMKEGKKNKKAKKLVKKLLKKVFIEEAKPNNQIESICSVGMPYNSSILNDFLKECDKADEKLLTTKKTIESLEETQTIKDFYNNSDNLIAGLEITKTHIENANKEDLKRTLNNARKVISYLDKENKELEEVRAELIKENRALTKKIENHKPTFCYGIDWGTRL